jgi:hypothetical protein
MVELAAPLGKGINPFASIRQGRKLGATARNDGGL